MPVSARKRAANRRNAQKSTGPRTPEGKARSRLNGSTHSIFCKDLLLPGENERVFRQLRHAMLMRIVPQDSVELMLADRIVSATWRLRRLQEAESMLHHARTREVIDAELDLKRDEAEDAGESFDETSFVSKIDPQAATAATILATRFSHDDATLERLSRYEQRLEFTIHRCLRDLHNLRARREKESEEINPARSLVQPTLLAPGLEDDAELRQIAEAHGAADESEECDHRAEAGALEKSNMLTEPTNASNLQGLVGSPPAPNPV